MMWRTIIKLPVSIGFRNSAQPSEALPIFVLQNMQISSFPFRKLRNAKWCYSDYGGLQVRARDCLHVCLCVCCTHARCECVNALMHFCSYRAWHVHVVLFSPFPCIGSSTKPLLHQYITHLFLCTYRPPPGRGCLTLLRAKPIEYYGIVHVLPRLQEMLFL